MRWRLCGATSECRVAGELEAENWRLSNATLARGAICGAENWRLCSATLVRRVSGELEDEHWRLCSATKVRGVAGERLRTE